MVTGLNNIPESYNSAILALKEAFFQGYGCVVRFAYSKGKPYVFKDRILFLYSTCLVEVGWTLLSRYCWRIPPLSVVTRRQPPEPQMAIYVFERVASHPTKLRPVAD
jgi:hypothetical protein